MASRSYSSTLRADQVRLSKERIAAAAAELFVEHGYAATTIGGIAKQAGVSLQTVYNVVGGKPALLALAYTWSLHSAIEPPVVTETDEFRELLDSTDAVRALRSYAAVARKYAERSGTIATIILGERGTPEVRKLARIMERQRLRGSERLIQLVQDRMGGLRPGLGVETAAEMLWAITGPENADRLVRDRGWSWDEYEQWIGDYCVRMLLS